MVTAFVEHARLQPIAHSYSCFQEKKYETEDQDLFVHYFLYTRFTS